MTKHHVVVIGGGIAGLAAAWFLGREGIVRVTVLEGSPTIGGKLRVSEVAGLPVDEGAEAMLARRPEGKDLVIALGLEDRLTEPATTDARVWTRGELRPLPKGHVMGVPTDLVALARTGILSPPGFARVPMDRVLPPNEIRSDVPVAAYIRARLGQEVVDRLIEPLLGGVYAGRADELSLDATLPRIAAAARTHRSLLEAAKEIIAETPKDAGPVFNSLTGGLGTLPQALADRANAVIRTDAMVRQLRRTPKGWRLMVGDESIDADAVVLAVPAVPAARLLREDVPLAAAELSRIPYASMAIVTLVYPRSAFSEVLTGSGYLVPPIEGHAVKAVTFSSVKWPWLTALDRDLVAVRCSIGRIGEESLLQRDDAELVALSMAELAVSTGVRGLPRETRVTRWGGSLPQYTVGHLDRVARIRGAVAVQPGLAVCGAAYDGLGVPACVATARTAAARVLDYLASGGEWRHDRGAHPQAQGT